MNYSKKIVFLAIKPLLRVISKKHFCDSEKNLYFTFFMYGVYLFQTIISYSEEINDSEESTVQALK